MNKAVIAGIAIIFVVAGIFAAKSFTGTGNAVKENVKEFGINAYRFGYTPDAITINKGDRVRIKINNTDTLHGIRIPELNLRDNNVLEFTADKQGEFAWYCANFCGQGHAGMQGKLIVK